MSEISVSGNGLDIAYWDFLPREADGTDFGSLVVVGDVVEHSFTVTNDGVTALTISKLKLPKGFKLADGLLPTIAANGGSDTFTVRIDTGKAGLKSGQITITNNDADEGSFAFGIIGEVVSSIPGPPVNGDGTDNVLAATVAAESFFGMGGIDSVSYAAQAGPSGVVASLLDPSKNTGFAAGDSYNSIEGLIGSAFDDTLTGDGGDNILEGGEGADRLDGGLGTDTASYASATDAVLADMLQPKFNFGEAWGDTYKLIENLTGSEFSDGLRGTVGANVIRGGAGFDEIHGAGGADTLFGGLDPDLFGYSSAKEGGDTIMDFISGEDVIGILNAGFKLSPAVQLGTGDIFDFADHYFVSSATGEADENHGQFAFNETTNDLFWDVDGTGKKAGVLLVHFATDVNLQPTDFFLFPF